jgi:transposase
MTKLKITSHFRWQIIEKWLYGSSQRRIAKHFEIGKTSVYRIIRHFQKYGSVEPLPSLHYKPRLFSENDLKYLSFLLNEKVDWYIWELQNEMELWLGRTIGYTTVWRALHRLGYTHKQVFRSNFFKFYM